MTAPPSGGAAGQGSSRSAVVVLAAGAAVLSLLRLLHARRIEALTSLPDEIGFLGNAWLLGRGEPAPPMAWAPFNPGGWSLLVAPIAALTDDPDTLAAAARVLNIVLAAAVIPALWALLGRLGHLDPMPRALAALAGGALPGLWVAGLIAWPDALLALLWPLTLLALGAAVRRGPVARRIWFGPAVALLWFGHARFLPALVLGAGFLILRIASPGLTPAGVRRARVTDVINLAAGAVVVLIGVGINLYLERRWDLIVDSPLSGITDAPADALGGAARSWVGQSWYALAATFGLAGVGAVTLGRVVVDASRRPRALWTESAPAMAAGALIGAAAVQVAAAVQLRAVRDFDGQVAFDLVANGRYQEVVLAPLVAVGLARIMRRVSASLAVEGVVAVAIVILGVVAAVAAGGDSLVIDPATASGVSWAHGWWSEQPMVIPSLLALVGLAFAAAVRSLSPDGGRRILAPVAALVAFSAIGWVQAAQVVDHSREVAAASPDLRRLEERLDGEPVSFSVDSDTYAASFLTGWELAGAGVVTFEAGTRPPTDLVLAPIDARGRPATRGLDDAVLSSQTEIVAGRAGRLGLWVLPGPVLERLEEEGALYPAGPGEDPSLTVLQAQIEPARTEVTARVGGGAVQVPVEVTHAGSGGVWPSAPGHPPFVLIATGAGGSTALTTTPIPLAETDPGQSATHTIDLRGLADLLGPGEHEMVLQVRLADGRPLQTVEGGELTLIVSE